MISEAYSDIKSIYEDLLSRDIDQQFFETWSQVKREVNDRTFINWIKLQQDSTDEKARSLFDDLSKILMPEAQKLDAKLEEKVLADSSTHKQFSPYVNKIKEIHDKGADANAELHAQVRTLTSKFEKLLSQAMVDLNKSMTIKQALVTMRNHPQQTERERIWRKIQEAKERIYKEGSRIFLEILPLRRQIANNSGLDTYTEYIYSQNKYYTAENAMSWLNKIDAAFAEPLEYYKEASKIRLEIETLHPWDVSAGFNVNARQFTQKDYIDTAKLAFGAVHENFRKIIEDIESKGNIDLFSRPNKSSGNFQASLLSWGEFFVFCNLSGHINDFYSLFHELGHALHYSVMSPGKLSWETSLGRYLPETLALILQTLAADKLGELDLITEEELMDYRMYSADATLAFLEEIAYKERFQQAVYASNISNVEEVEALFSQCLGPSIADWSHLEDNRNRLWLDRHVLSYPFYNLEYIIAEVATLVFVDRFRRNEEESTEKLIEVMRHDSRNPFPESLQMLDVHFPFEDKDFSKASSVLLENLKSSSL